ncbi:MAG: hypothetical protein JW776_14190 [Candidatus Lokiarchaeota archaeon]|nr:hypothetical protein [Candidatus Lokiarchaeota archaeon]
MEYTIIDGSTAHQGVGIDGEIFLASMVANAFEISNIQTLIRLSLKMLPKAIEYRKFIEKCFEIDKNHSKWREGRASVLKH